MTNEITDIDNVYYRGAYSRRRQRRVKLWKDDTPIIIECIIQCLPEKWSVIDIGASIGVYVRKLRERGFKAIGIDATPNIEKISNRLVQQVDITDKDQCKLYYKIADFGIFIEVGEHIPEEYEQDMLDNICSMVRRRLVITWADHGQSGFHHVNCKSQVYVACEFAKRGWYVNEELTQKSRLPRLKYSYRTRLMVLDKAH